MKFPFKTIIISSLATIAAFTAVVYTSCNRDKCKTIVCANGGVCNDGACTCASGYEGTNCEKVSRDKFLGNWTVFEKGSITLAAQYPISIEPTTDVYDVVIKNFYNYFRTPIKATVVGDSLFIPNQQYEGKVLFGVGYIFSNVTYGQYGAIEMRYSIIDTATQKVNDFGYNAAINNSDPSLWNK
ncbi:MAG: calcium-binding EGF-like domain-containing protein [Taibaiella sp.]|jgi:hypothetical protein|nr:calcium-binding EGF-like domain-containing protein [Taibaiella sp.]